MIRSSASLLAQDITVRCRVRRSKTALNPSYGDAQEMTVTMRNWDARHHQHLHRQPSLMKRSSRSDPLTLRMVIDDHNHNGPELLLTTMTHYRDDIPTHAYSIPIVDIMVVETRAGARKLTVTTISYGVFEFHCQNENGHDILLAFLQASLAKERIQQNQDDTTTCCSTGIPPSPSNTSCIDVDVFTARHVRGRVESETLSEKISRRMGKVVHSLQEMSGNFCDVACCQGEVRDPPVNAFPRSQQPSRRPARSGCQQNDFGKTVLPALSMESDPEMEYVVR